MLPDLLDCVLRKVARSFVFYLADTTSCCHSPGPATGVTLPASPLRLFEIAPCMAESGTIHLDINHLCLVYRCLFSLSCCLLLIRRNGIVSLSNSLERNQHLLTRMSSVLHKDATTAYYVYLLGHQLLQLQKLRLLRAPTYVSYSEHRRAQCRCSTPTFGGVELCLEKIYDRTWDTLGPALLTHAH
jgi:hypothetical protein